MWMGKAIVYGADMALSIFAVYLCFYYMDTFFVRKKNRLFSIVGMAVFILWQLTVLTPIVLPAYINLVITIVVTLFMVAIAYEGTWWNKCIFAISFNAIWMLMETLSNYILVIYYEEYADVQPVGSCISKGLFFIVIIMLQRVFTDDEIRELPAKYSIMLVLIPTGSIYIMNSIFMLSLMVNNKHSRLNSAVTAILLLGMNILIFYIYMKLADDLQLRRMTSVYEQQFELYERHQQEQEISTMKLRDVRHNMKNNLISILAYAENGDYDKMTEFVREILGEGRIAIESVSNSGNMVIDSLIGYWYVTAKEKGIRFSVDTCVPMAMPFKGADISLILGNLLENAVEAAQKANDVKYIKIRIKYDKNNLLLFMMNSYKGPLLKSKNGKLKSTKLDHRNHGIGLASVYRTVAKYHGTVIIEDSIPEQFKIQVLLYGF